MSARRNIPKRIRQQLRQEAFFGCCMCGDPILDYHHIIPWSERQHNEAEHMIALCPTHHRVAGKMRREQQYKIKNDPINARNGYLKGLLVSDKLQTEFLMGSNVYVNTPIILSYYELPIIKYRIHDGQALISAYLPRTDFWPEMHIEDNDLLIKTADAWDVEFRSNYLKFIKSDTKHFFEIDFRFEVARVAGALQIGDSFFSFDEHKTNVGSARFSNNRIEDSKAGITFGDQKHRLLVPNYAMRNPTAVMHKFLS